MPDPDTDTPTPSAGLATDWQAQRTHCSDATSRRTRMRLRHHSARARALGGIQTTAQGQCSCGGTDVFCQSGEDEIHRVDLRDSQCRLLVYPFAWRRKVNQLPEVVFSLHNTDYCPCLRYYKWYGALSFRISLMKTFLDFVNRFFQLQLCIWLYSLMKRVIIIIIIIIIINIISQFDFFRWWHVSSFTLKAGDKGWTGKRVKGTWSWPILRCRQRKLLLLLHFANCF